MVLGHSSGEVERIENSEAELRSYGIATQLSHQNEAIPLFLQNPMADGSANLSIPSSSYANNIAPMPTLNQGFEQAYLPDFGLNADDYLDLSDYQQQEQIQINGCDRLDFNGYPHDYAIPPFLDPSGMIAPNSHADHIGSYDNDVPQTSMSSYYVSSLATELKPAISDDSSRTASHLPQGLGGAALPDRATDPFQTYASTPFQLDSHYVSPTYGSSIVSTPDTFSTLVSTHSPAIPIPSAALRLNSDSSTITYDNIAHTSHIDPIDGLTERLGEFLFSPTEGASKGEDICKKKMRRNSKGVTTPRTDDAQGWSLVRNNQESDGLTAASRELLWVFVCLPTLVAMLKGYILQP